MPTPDEVRAEIAAGRETFRAALQAAAAGDWERTPEGEGRTRSGDPEAAWSARKVAEHAIPAEAFFATAVCTACGYPGVEFSNRSYASAAEALTAFDEVIEVTNKKIKYVTETDLEKPQDGFGSVLALMSYQPVHLTEHAAQLKAAAGV
jgi:hypothetical protein